MKFNTGHLVGAAIVLAVVFLTSVDAQNTPPKIEPQKWGNMSTQQRIVFWVVLAVLILVSALI